MSQLALVTGASSGIGRAYAERLAAEGYDLIVTGRRKDRLDELAAALHTVDVQVAAVDLSTEDGIDTLTEIAGAQPITLLVNCAGVAHYMPLTELPPAQARELIILKALCSPAPSCPG